MARANGISVSSDSDLVHIVFQVKEKAKEAIKMSTSKGYELVEANGFKMIRKRKASAAGVAEPTQGSKDEASLGPKQLSLSSEDDTPQADGEDKENEGQPALGSLVEQPTPEEPCEQASMDQSGDTAPSTESGPVMSDSAAQILRTLPKGCPEALKLQFVLNGILTGAASKHDMASTQEGGEVWALDAAQSVTNAFSRLLEQKVEGSCSAVLDGSAPPDLDALPPMLRDASHSASLKTSLQLRLKALQQEEAHWNELRTKYKISSEPEGDGKEVVSTVQEGGERPSPEEQPAAAEASTELDASKAVGGDGVEGTSTCAPNQMLAESQDACLPTQPVVEGALAEHVGADVAAEEAGEAMQVDGAVESVLQATQEETHAKLTLQVESLCAVLSKVDCLVATAEQACSMLQADYHQDKFKTFPHVNSPAWLIREIATRHVPAQEEEGLGGFGTPV
eukprot:gene10242-8159_t